MDHYMYIIYSESKGVYYKGETSNLQKRIEEHNQGQGTYTRNKGPWVLCYAEKHKNRSDALKREKALKRLNHRSIEKLIGSGIK